MYQQQPIDRHMIIPLTDDELKKVRGLALDDDQSMKEWVRMAVMVQVAVSISKPPQVTSQ